MLNGIEGQRNRFHGVEIEPDALPDVPDGFQERLSHSIREWKEEGLQVAWFKVPLSRAFLIPVLVDAGSIFHHSTTEYLMLTLRLVDDAFVPL